MKLIDISHAEEIYTVSRLNREVRFLLESHYPLLWIEGEISNFAAPHSGHWYFSLKDKTAQVKCAMFRTENRKLNFLVKDGMHVVLKAHISVYEGRGDFQLIVEHLEEAGKGKLREEFERLKKHLLDAGLFDPTHKKKLPHFPKIIGVITSRTGAAIRDIISVLKRRFSSADIIIYPTLVQGEQAATHIVSAIQIANRRNECDVLILARGGGSLEDLWPFNEEKVAYAIYHSVLPIISGVGHEIDFTIADFVADQRAPTPSAAAEIAVPDSAKLLESISQYYNHILRLIQQKLHHLHQHLTWTTKHLQQQHPKRKLAEQAQRLDFYELALIRLQYKILHAYQTQWQTLQAKLFSLTPKHCIREYQHQLNQAEKVFETIIKKKLQQQQQLLGNLAGKLDGLSPLSTLQRGFAIVTREKTHEVIQQANNVHVGEKINVKLREGILNCQVEKIL